eukprot:8447035-Pyramimonas_sp.AAC.1
MEKNYADRIAAPLDPQFSWGNVGDAIRGSLQRLVEDPAMGVALYTVLGLHPHQWSIADPPRQPGRLDRKAWGHLGFCTDVELGIDASNLVYNLTWAALVWFLELGTPWATSRLAVPEASPPPTTL